MSEVIAPSGSTYHVRNSLEDIMCIRLVSAVSDNFADSDASSGAFLPCILSDCREEG